MEERDMRESLDNIDNQIRVLKKHPSKILLLFFSDATKAVPSHHCHPAIRFPSAYLRLSKYHK